MTTAAIHLSQTCEHCGGVFWPKAKGPTPTYCTKRCKQRAYRRRLLMQRFEVASAWLRNEIATRNETTWPEGVQHG